jgi:hypothetical protein
MLSPFPGMNPYLEAPALWSEVHSWLIVELARMLNQRITPRYRAAVEKRVYEESIERYLEVREVVSGAVVRTVRVGPSQDYFLSRPMEGVGALMEVDLQRCERVLLIPLRSSDEAVAVDLNVLMQLVYESAALDLAIDYSKQPVPGLGQEDFAWVRSIV